DQWAFYQAKSLRRYQSEVARDVLGAMGGAAAAQLSRKYVDSMARYEKEGEEIQEHAREFENESQVSGRRALRLHFGEIFLEMALVLASLAILTKRGALWMASMGGAGVGAAAAATVFFVFG
ncbi:MAG TPA: DUF4337 family protein, partial [Bryobacteraceae bacterium]